ncbi:MAG: tetratricopeptide repeat protein [Ferruginibacter sp.]
MIRHIRFKQTCFCIWLLLVYSCVSAQSANEFYAIGNNLFNKRQYDEALENYSKAIQKDPSYTYAYLSRGNVYAAKNMPDLAIQDYSTVIGLDPGYNLGYFNRGLAYHTKGKLDLAIQDFTKAIELNPAYKNSYYNRGNTYQLKNMPDLAIRDYNKAISLDPEYAFAYQGRGNVYYGRKRYDSAMLDYNKAVMLQPRNAVNYYNRANVLTVKNQADSAIEDYNRALTFNANYANAYQGRAAAYNNKREYDRALQDLAKAISLEPEAIRAYNNRGLTYLFKGEYDLAISDFKKGISLDTKTEHPYVILNIIEPFARLNRFSEAATYYADFRTRYVTGYIDKPGWGFFKKYMEAVTEFIVKNDFRSALANLQEAEKLYSTKSKVQSSDDSQARSFSSILALKGYVLERLNNNEEAKQAYEQALVINANEPDVIAALARLSKKSEVLVKNDNTPPTINILEPLINQRSISVEDDKVAGTKQRIRGKALDPSGIRSLMINNKPLKVEESGYFDTVVNINEGINTFTIVVTDNNANSISENVLIVTGKEKGIAPAPDKPNTVIVDYTPVYHAVLIAESEYTDKNIPSLEAPVADMYKIYNLLVKNYVFTPENTDTLVNATRANILEAIIKKANAMNENDNLLIFYAGHGQMITQPDKTEEGFLVPQDAVKGNLSSYISSDDLLRTIKYSKARHILFVADACFAGTLFRDISSEAPMAVADAYKDKSRKLLASGNRTAVPDKSEFIEYFRLALQENRERYITAEQLIDSFKNQYRNTTRLQIQYFPIKNVEDLGGQFVFKRK